MAEVDDGYDGYYANRLWQLLPGRLPRAATATTVGVTGPLQELVARIGAQVAVVRRSIDRLWADQSIETSDDWVIPYIGDLLDTNLVNGLDAPRQRLDVAKTIHYRRRKGTLAVLEEIARDVTGWDAHVVEGFRRLSRTRHSLDPPVGPGPCGAALPTPCPSPTAPADAPDPRELLAHEGLIGPLTGTPAGGFADLRSIHGASLADSPFDEYFHTADVRFGQGAVGRYGDPQAARVPVAPAELRGRGRHARAGERVSWPVHVRPHRAQHPALPAAARARGGRLCRHVDVGAGVGRARPADELAAARRSAAIRASGPPGSAPVASTVSGDWHCGSR